ncbi:MAG: CDP-alcohol phosphatidyltransferase family protein [Prevotella sp.]|nr:CDP-alcohol phosphatidyltransferase family protein [Prevotella sp.]
MKTNYRDTLQRLIYTAIDPFLRFLLRLHVTPNVVTVMGLVGNAIAAWLFVLAAQRLGSDEASAYALVAWGGVVILLSGLLDMMDGRLARLGNMSSKFGALLDSSLDRYSELLTLSGIALLLLRAGDDWFWAAVATFAAIVGSVMVSYVRARAEGLGISCKVGLMQRPERVVVTAVAAIATGLASDPLWLAIGMTIIALLANLTAIWRIIHCFHA